MLKTVLSEVTGAAVLFCHFFGQLSRKVTALFVSFITFHISSHQVVLPLQELRVTCGCVPPATARVGVWKTPGAAYSLGHVSFSPSVLLPSLSPSFT